MTSESMKDVEFFNREAKKLAEDLHHEARFEKITGIIEKYFSNIWLDGFLEGYEQGKEGLTIVEGVDGNDALSDATGEA
jgi:hypothetical protein